MKKIINKIFNYWKYKKFFNINNDILEIGAATYNLNNILILLKKFSKIYFLQKCYRQFDSYLFFKNKLCIHNQIQVIIKSIPLNFLKLYKDSLFFLKKKIYFKRDNWNSPLLGAKGIGYEVICENTEISQITIFYTFGNKKLYKPLLELTYGIDRISNLLKNEKNFLEKFFSIENIFKKKKIKKILFLFKNCLKLIKKKNFYLSYVLLLKISNNFNIIDEFYLQNNYNRLKIIILIKKIFEKIYDSIKLYNKKKNYKIK